MATAAPPSTSLNVPNRPTYSCIRCADRKVKCDRQRPCSNCIKRNVDCVFHPSPPPRKKHKRVKEQILNDRLKHYEALLQEKGIDPSKVPDTPNLEPGQRLNQPAPVVPEAVQVQTPSSIESDSNHSINKPQIVQGQGRSKFVDNYLWTRVVEEFHNPEDALDSSSSEDHDFEASDDEFSLVLGSESKSSAKLHHPSTERIYQLWQVFVENVDPITKFVHVPTLRPAIQKAVSNIKTVPRSFEALMFAIYGAAIMSLKDDECKQKFDESRKTLLSRYISATKVALSRAKFMGTTSLVVLQALVLHIFSVREIYEPRAVWSLTGVAVRIAEGMGLDRDGTSLNLPPFETEMRRRIWWLLKTHDYRTAELCGLPKFRDLDTSADSTAWPTNVNDDQLYPGMPPPVAASDTITDMVFIALRCELANFAAARIAKFREQGKGPSQWMLHASVEDKKDILGAFKDVEETLETKFLRYCDPCQPLHLLTMLIARFSMNIVRFLTHHPRRWGSLDQTPDSERQFVWNITIKLLEQHSMMMSNPLLKCFSWHAPYYQQWHAIIHVLDSLRADPIMADAESAWQLISTIYENTPDMAFDMKKPIHAAVGSLCLKAWTDRETALRNKDLYLGPTPEFILQLRQQREAAKARKQARDAKSHRPKHLDSQTQSEIHDNGLGMDITVPFLSDTLESTNLQQNQIPMPPISNEFGAAPEEIPFWLSNGFDDSQSGNWDGVVNMDWDIILAEDQNVQDNAPPPISWDQWDTWLADSNVMPPLSSTWDTGTGAD